MTLEARAKAIRDLEAILSNLAYKDFKRANPVRRIGRDGRRIHKPYNLSSDTMEALEVLSLACKQDITAEDGEIIKGFLLPYRVNRREYLINTNPRLQ